MRNRKLDMALVRRFVANEFAPHWRRGILSFVFMALAAIATTASVWVIQYVINDIFIDKRADLILPIALAIMSIYVLKGAATYGYNVILAVIAADLAATMRTRVFDQLIDREIAYFDRNDHSDLINRISNVTKSAGDLVRLLSTSAMRDALTVIFLIAYMLYQDAILTIATFLLAPPVIWGVGQISKRIQSSVSDEFGYTSRFLQLLFERLGGIRLIKSYGHEDETKADLGNTIDELRNRATRIGRVSALNSPLMETLGGIAVAVMIIYSGYAIIARGATAGGMFSFILAFISAYEPIKRLANLRVDLVKFTVPLGFYYDLIDEPVGQANGKNDLKLTRGEISFKDVDFSYPEGGPVLNKTIFTAPAGKTTALVGKSGSGKSTVFALLQRFYDAKSGTITIDGQNIDNVLIDGLRRTIAPIPQDTSIFTMTIAQNIAIGRPDATIDQIHAAATAAHMDEFVNTMPDGYETMLGDGEASLSGGQRQRLSIARAILKDAPILLLDEATSALDSASEAIVQRAIEVAAKDRTVLIIAHRLSTIRAADQILVMDQGAVIESGTHSELMALDSAYRKLHDLQFRDM